VETEHFLDVKYTSASIVSDSDYIPCMLHFRKSVGEAAWHDALTPDNGSS
jgi:hypothetical protein